MAEYFQELLMREYNLSQQTNTQTDKHTNTHIHIQTKHTRDNTFGSQIISTATIARGIVL